MAGRTLGAASLALGVALGCSSEEPVVEPEEPLTLELLQEGEKIHTNGVVRFEVAITGSPESVGLVRTGETWVELDDTLAFEWDTTKDPEGRWEVSAFARAGDDELTTGSVVVEVDRTPPGLHSRSPEPMEVLLADTYGISVNFTEPILPSSIDAASVRLSSGGRPIEADLMLASDRRLLTVSPKGVLGAGNHRLELTDGIMDRAGNRLTPASWIWTARDAMERVVLSIDGVDGTVAVTNEPIVLRVQAEGSPQKIELLRNGASWTTLSGPSFAWDLSGVWEGTFVIQARATYAFHEILSNVVNVNVDRRAPTASPVFKSFVTTRELSDLRFNLSEPLLPGSLTDDSVQISSERGTPTRRTIDYLEQSWSLRLRVQGTQSPDRLVVSLNEGVTDIAGNPMVPVQFRLAVSDWKGLGGALNEAGPGGRHPAAASVQDGRPVVAWVDQAWEDGNAVGNVRVRRWSGTKWTELPDPSDGGDFVTLRPAVALTPNDRPVVAWIERAAGVGEPSRLHVRRWDGNAWQRLGAASLELQPGCDADDPALAVDGAGNPVVAWSEQVTCMPASSLGERRVLVKRWTGSDWELLGGEGLPEPSGGEGGASSAALPAVAVDRQGGVVIAWVRDVELQLHRWNGAAWIPFAAPLPPTGAHLWPRVAIDPEGRAVVAVVESKHAGDGVFLDDLHVMRFDGAAWEALGGKPVALKRPLPIHAVDLALDRVGEPIVAWGEVDENGDGTAYVSRWTDAGWSRVGPGEPFVSAAGGRGMSMAFDRDRPVLALGHDVPEVGSILVRSPE
ncbi:MAG TPA: Ig-like domain-containing protein [Vulgatibacter sp.]|nr:Ig-like domain-containing protein [Vulgatibacter sp.]